MSIRWVVRAGEDATIGDVVARAGGDARAIEEGRVFIGRRRVRVPTELARSGDELTIAPARAASASDEPAIAILARAGDIVIVDKPAGIPTIPDHSGASHSLVALTARALGVDVSRVHPTSRLDREVSGAVTFALSPRAAAHLTRAREQGAYERRYVAIAGCPPSPAIGTWNAPIGRASDPRHRAPFGKDAVAAETRFQTVARLERAALLALAPLTGRTHQLRVHASHAGAPLLGDRTYGGLLRATLATGRVVPIRRIALHAARVVVPRAPGAGRVFRGDGDANSSLVALSPIPKDLAELWLSLGGDPIAWDIAVSCPL